MYLDYFYLATVLLLSALALVHFYKTRSLYSILMLLYLIWPGIFRYICKHSVIHMRDVDTMVLFLSAEKLVSVLLVVPFFLYVMNKDMEKSRAQKADKKVE